MLRRSGSGARAKPEDHLRRGSRAESWPCLMPPIGLTTCGCRRVIAWRNSRVIAKGSTAFESMTSTEFASFSVTAMRMRSKLLITTRTWMGVKP